PQLTETFDKFSLSNKREYIEWLTEAKSETTRNKRLQTALEWISDGKPRNWKYMKKYSGK
ncbi:MAG TPA: YdeI/OmpD-associated family protein, partial [Ignavibacteria bacterium]|nr:YdeI/OmpD-associated family protein [Ignavibacteria bacterium]